MSEVITEIMTDTVKDIADIHSKQLQKSFKQTRDAVKALGEANDAIEQYQELVELLTEKCRKLEVENAQLQNQVISMNLRRV